MRHSMEKKILAMLAVMMLCCMTVFAAAEGTGEPVNRTDLAEEDYIGTWNLKYMIIEGYTVTAESMGLQASIVITDGQIEINSAVGRQKTYETVYADGKLTFVNDKDEKMVVYITEDGLLHVDHEAEVLIRIAEDEDSSLTKGGDSNMLNLSESMLAQYYERVEE